MGRKEQRARKLCTILTISNEMIINRVFILLDNRISEATINPHSDIRSNADKGDVKQSQIRLPSK